MYPKIIVSAIWTVFISQKKFELLSEKFSYKKVGTAEPISSFVRK